MLRTAAELRYEPFLWVADLSQADTIAVVAGFPINLFPIIMGVTMFYQMQIMPVSPTADPLQQKILNSCHLSFWYSIQLLFRAGHLLDDPKYLNDHSAKDDP